MNRILGDAARGREGEATVSLRGLRYDNFVSATLYEQTTDSDVALASVVALAEKTIQRGGAVRTDKRITIPDWNTCDGSHWPLAGEEDRGSLRRHVGTVPLVLVHQLNRVRV